MNRSNQYPTDEIIHDHIATLPTSYTVVITAPPTQQNHHTLHFQKRQLYSDTDDQLQADLVNAYSAYLNQPLQHHNSTNIFAPKPNSGLLHRYVFFTPSLTFALLVTFLLFIPIVVLSVAGIGSIATVAGLEGKMTGTVGLDPAKA